VQLLGDRFDATARDATEAERPELWSLMTHEWPSYDDYQKKTDRQIPVVVLERA
jgi:deazaflavin-dependent oxidoreductase (nitroreductase family)